MRTSQGKEARQLRQKGQISVLLGMMMMTFVLFFTFVVNTGMLVNAKINLQNAADMAAYAGAAVQARQLNDISYLNYEMRRQFKKFLYRYYVIGNMAQDTHPTQPVSGPRKWSPDGVKDYGVPAVCMSFLKGDNFCKMPQLNRLQIPPKTTGIFDSVNTTMINQLQQLEKIRQENCDLIGQSNRTLLFLWLWNTDPTLTALEQQIASQPPTPGTGQDRLPETLRTMRGLAKGLGLFPKNIILKRRIDTLSEFVNHKAERVTIDRLNDMRSSKDWAALERPIQAFLSAYYTLGSDSPGTTFSNTESIQMEELLPPGPFGAQLINLSPIVAEFDTFWVNMIKVGMQSDGTADCRPTLEPFVSSVPPPVIGVYKDPNLLTYYAVKLQAEAKIMFSPFGDITLKAYSAAQPFGSRLGPKGGKELFTADYRLGPDVPPCSATVCKGKIPWLPVMDNGKGWEENFVLGTLFNQMPQSGGVVDQAAMDQAYQSAMAPNPWESGKYNILSDLNPDPMIQGFDETSGLHAVWAPIISGTRAAAGGNVLSEVTQIIQDLQAGGQTQLPPNLKDALRVGLIEYFEKLKNSQGEEGESFNVARISDPFTRAEGNAGRKKIAMNTQILLNDVKKVKTSWNEPYSASHRNSFRTGYSVKFVSFPTLMNRDASNSDGQGGKWTNVPTGLDADAENDLGLIKH